MTDLGRRVAKLGEYAGQEDDEELEQEPELEWSEATLDKKEEEDE